LPGRLSGDALDLPWYTTDGGMCWRCQHLVGHPISLVLQRIINLSDNKLRLYAGASQRQYDDRGARLMRV
jgi:hypothetical protein